jgi:hypothetical protein
MSYGLLNFTHRPAMTMGGGEAILLCCSSQIVLVIFTGQRF